MKRWIKRNPDKFATITCLIVFSVLLVILLLIVVTR